MQLQVQSQMIQAPMYSKLKRYIRFNVPLKPKTSFKIGGCADIFFEPPNREYLIEGLPFFASLHLPISILGGGTNILVSDKGVSGAVVSLKALSDIKLHDTTMLTVEAGALTDTVSKFCVYHGLQGFENFARLPGSIGGAVFMNARCYETQISDILKSVTVLQYDGAQFTEKTIPYNDSEWAYKLSPFQKHFSGIELQQGGTIITSATFSVAVGNKADLTKKYKTIAKMRKEKKQFKKPSCGSTFKNNRAFGKPTGAIIEELGLKGTKYGKAQVAPFHGNFIINLGGARADDVQGLIQKIQAEAKHKKGIILEPEVIFAGRWGDAT